MTKIYIYFFKYLICTKDNFVKIKKKNWDKKKKKKEKAKTKTFCLTGCHLDGLFFAWLF